MDDEALILLPKSKDDFLRWLRRLGSLPDAYKALTHQPYLKGVVAAKRAVEYIIKNDIEKQAYEILDQFFEMQIKEPLTKDELAVKISELIIDPHVKPTDSIKAAETLMKLNGWEIKKTQSEIITAKGDLQDMLNTITH